MAFKSLVKQGIYQDSVALMQISKYIGALPGVLKASVMMGTPHNKNVLLESGLYDDNVKEAQTTDMIISIQADTKEALEAAIKAAENELEGQGDSNQHSKGSCEELKITTISNGLEVMNDAKMAVISVPGLYAAAEALKALKNGLNVFLFSDNVSLEEEISIKRFAHERGLIVMGPDCGTAMVGGVPLGFSNMVNSGRIGVAGASGTGTQEVMCLIDKWGGGVSQVFGTGGRDISEEVGGITMMDILSNLSQDPNTDVIAVISKPPSPSVANKITSLLENASKPAVVCLLGSCEQDYVNDNIYYVGTLEKAAEVAVKLEKGEKIQLNVKEEEEVFSLSKNTKYLRGLFSGGSLAEEALCISSKMVSPIYSNLKGTNNLTDINESIGHTIIDMGDDEFTIGRPHPMIEYSYRIERLKQEAADENTGVIIMDVVLGYGAHPDPSEELVPVITEILRDEENKDLKIVINIVGTDKDPQNIKVQIEKFKSAGAIIGETNAQAIMLAIEQLKY